MHGVVVKIETQGNLFLAGIYLLVMTFLFAGHQFMQSRSETKLREQMSKAAAFAAHCAKLEGEVHDGWYDEWRICVKPHSVLARER